jgi:hypothetical protein
MSLCDAQIKKIDKIYKIDNMRRMKINPVNIVNPVYFLRSAHVALRRPERMKIAPLGRANCQFAPPFSIGERNGC